MSIAILSQVYDETRRLSIAGSTVAPGDFRLKKLIEPLQKAGEKAPVFAKVAQAMTKVVESTEKTSADALLELSTLVNAILYTQGETGMAGDIQPIETTDLGPQESQAGARVLKPLLESLTTTGSGRMEIIKDAFERGAFRDLRLVKPALQALDDTYAEISDFVGKKVLPLYGKAILPELRAKFDIKGKSGHLRRLSLMHRLDPAGTRETVKKALDEGSKEMKVVAIECLGEAAEDLSYLLEQAKAKTKDVRQAALKGLAKSDEGDALAALHAALKGNDLEIAVGPVRTNRNPKLLKLVLDEAQAQVDLLLAGKEKDKKKQGEQVGRMLNLLECLRGRDDKQTEAFLLKCFAQQDKLAEVKGEPSGKDIVERLVNIMSTGPEGTREALIKTHAQLDAAQLPYAFIAARKTLKPPKVFEMFSPYLTAKVDEKKKTKDPAYNKRHSLLVLLEQPWQWRYFGFDYLAGLNDDEDSDEADEKLTANLDPRWLDVAVAIENVELVRTLARPNHKQANALLETAFAEKSKKANDYHDALQILSTMVRVQHPAATDAFMVMLLKNTKNASWGWYTYYLGPLIPDLPKEALPRIEEALPKLPEKAIDQLIEHVQALKAKP
jgi:hypothetical protein